VTFEPFGDFESRGYLRNFASVNDPEQGHLDNYLQPFIRDAVKRQQSASVLKSLKGLGETTTGEE
jgi:hypothetical protein